MTLLSDLQAVRDSIWVHGPEHFDMDRWFSTSEDLGYDLEDAGTIDINACGTTGCIAGHAALVTGCTSRQGIATTLGLPGFSYHVPDTMALGSPLFYGEYWDEVKLSDGTTLADRLIEEGSDEWATALAYFDDRIKTLENGS